MKRKRHLNRWLSAFLLFMLIIGLSACTNRADPSELSFALPTNDAAQQAEDANAPEVVTGAILDADDVNTAYDAATATNIQLNGAAIEINGSGASADESVLTITAPGTYILKGTLDDGQVIVDATKDDLVRIVLDGVSITNQTGAPLYAAQCEKLIVTLAENTQNALIDGGASFAYNNETDEEPNAAFFSKDDLTINGTGSLSVTAGFNNGIGTKDDLVIISGDITVNAENHGIKGNDSVTILGGHIAVSAGSDAIQTDNAEEGSLRIEGGDFTLTAENDGIQADTDLTITSGTFTITTGESARASNNTDGSYKGVKSSGSITITSGSFIVNSYDDSIHANGSIAISGGDITLDSGDDAVHADENLTASGGSIAVLSSFEGLEAQHITISGGVIDVMSSDDGINAAGGDSEGEFGRFGRDSFGGGDYSIDVSGGTITVHAGGDGFDSNGMISISGGTIVCLILSSMDNEAMDCDGAFSITGGTVIYGGTNAGQVPGSDSTQSYVVFSGTISAGSELRVTQNDAEIARATIGIDCQVIAVSTPDIISGQSYALYSESNQIATATAGTGGGSMMGGRGGMNENRRGGNGW